MLKHIFKTYGLKKKSQWKLENVSNGKKIIHTNTSGIQLKPMLKEQ